MRKVIIIDDEPLARSMVKEYLQQHPNLHLIQECNDGFEGLKAIQQYQPDLIFLDVQMPELDGLEVIEAVGAGEMPLTIFVTAYDKHAIRAFEANALDYLLKPFSDERWEAALARAKTRCRELSLHEFGGSVLRMLATRPQASGYLDRLVVKGSGTTRFIRVAEIDWIEGAGVYVNLHASRKELLYRSTLNELSDHLDPMRFMRIHRSTIVNIDSIVELRPISHGEFELLLKDGHRPRISRTYRIEVEKRLGQSL